MTNKSKIQSDIPYEKHDVLKIQVDVRPDNHVWEAGLLKHGIQEVEVPVSTLYMLERLVADENEVNDLESLIKQSNLRKARLIKELEPKLQPGTAAYDEAVDQINLKNNPYTRFFEDNGRDARPIKSAIVVENLGPRANDAVAVQTKAIAANDKLAQILELLVEEKLAAKQQLNQSKQPTK
jgi:hypothetical protein